jgi:hypothetical protein
MKKNVNFEFEEVSYLQSDKYELFDYLPFNRPVDNAHVNKLMESMKIHGFKGVIQVIKTSFIEGKVKLYILEGQHRFASAMRLGIPFKFELTELVSQHETAEFIAELNNSAKSWGTSQFLKVWSGLGIKEYVKLNKVFNDTGFQITPLIEAYTFSPNMQDFRKGSLTFVNEDESDKIIERMIELNQYLPKKAFCRRQVVRMLRNPKYNHKKMKLAIQNYIQVMGGFSENERELKKELQRLMDNNCK